MSHTAPGGSIASDMDYASVVDEPMDQRDGAANHQVNIFTLGNCATSSGTYLLATLPQACGVSCSLHFVSLVFEAD